MTQTVQGCKLASRQRGTGRCWQPRGQALTLPPHCPPGSASLWDPHLRLTAPHAPDRQEGGHGAGPRRPREGGSEQRRPLQPPLPGRDPPPPCPCPAHQGLPRARPWPCWTFHLWGPGPRPQGHTASCFFSWVYSKPGTWVVDSGVWPTAGFGDPGGLLGTPVSEDPLLCLTPSWPEVISQSQLPAEGLRQRAKQTPWGGRAGPAALSGPALSPPPPGDPHAQEGRVCPPGESCQGREAGRTRGAVPSRRGRK